MKYGGKTKILEEDTKELKKKWKIFKKNKKTKGMTEMTMKYKKYMLKMKQQNGETTKEMITWNVLNDPRNPQKNKRKSIIEEKKS